MPSAHELQRQALQVATLVMSLLLTTVATAGNLPPVAEVVGPGEALVDEEVQFDGAGSFDPDEGPEPITWRWDLGDGTTSMEPVVRHGYAEPGAYEVLLTVSDGQTTSSAGLTVVVLEPPAEPAPVASSSIVADPTNQRVWVVNTDSSSVSSIDLETGQKVAEVAVGGRPRTLSFMADGRLVVACEAADSLWVVDPATYLGSPLPVDVGHEPFGVVAAPDGRLLVSAQGSGVVVLLSEDGREELGRFVAGGRPRSIAVVDDRAFVTDFLTSSRAGRVFVLDLAAREQQAPVLLPSDPGPDTASSGRGVPNLLTALVAEPSGERVFFGGLKSNSERGTFVSGQPLIPTNRVRGVFGPIDVAAGVEPSGQRFDTNDADSVSAIVFTTLGRFAIVTHQGLGRISVYDVALGRGVDRSDGSSPTQVARLDVGHAPSGIVVVGNPPRAVVSNYLSRDVTVVDISEPDQPAVLETIAVTDEPLPPIVALGKRLFFRSRPPRHSMSGYIACASCHADGARHDGRTWDFTQYGEGLRNTIDLRGHGGVAHGPVHWTGNFDEIQDFELDIRGGFGGDGLLPNGSPHPADGAPNAGRSADLDALAVYVSTLTESPASPFRGPDGALTPAAERGLAIFASAETGCLDCHVPPRYTDSGSLAADGSPLLHDVGTVGPGSGARLGERLEGLDTPTLLGLWDTAPYLHDGSAASLDEVLVERNVGDTHGKTSHLTTDEVADLVQWLLSIDGRSDGRFAQDSDDAGRPTGSDVATPDVGSFDVARGPTSDATEGCGCQIGGAALPWRVGIAMLSLVVSARVLRR